MNVIKNEFFIFIKNTILVIYFIIINENIHIVLYETYISELMVIYY